MSMNQADKEAFDKAFRDYKDHVKPEYESYLNGWIDTLEYVRSGEAVAWVEVKSTHGGPYEFHGLQLLAEGKHQLFTHSQPAPSPDVAQAKKAEVRIEKFGVVSEKNGIFSLDGFNLDCQDFENIDGKDFVVYFLEAIKKRIQSEIEKIKTDADFRFNNSRFNGKLIE